MAVDATRDDTRDVREEQAREERKLVVVKPDTSTRRGGGAGRPFEKGNRAQLIAHERRRRQPVNVIAQLDRQARRVVQELFLSVKGGTMTAPIANALILGLRFRSELYSGYQAAEEVQRLYAELEELRMRFQRFKQGILSD